VVSQGRAEDGRISLDSLDGCSGRFGDRWGDVVGDAGHEVHSRFQVRDGPGKEKRTFRRYTSLKLWALQFDSAFSNIDCEYYPTQIDSYLIHLQTTLPPDVTDHKCQSSTLSSTNPKPPYSFNGVSSIVSPCKCEKSDNRYVLLFSPEFTLLDVNRTNRSEEGVSNARPVKSENLTKIVTKI
jgi:hypothetical protein